MSHKAAITLQRSPEEAQRLWHRSEFRPSYIDGADAAVTFTPAPGDRGTEIHVDLAHKAPAGILGETIQKLLGTEPLARVKDDLRCFKQHVETGEIARSDATPGGESLKSKLRQRPAQPLSESERAKYGAAREAREMTV